MELHISLSRRGALGRELYQQLRLAILDGRLPAGAALPASRELAARLAISRNTVLGAYQRLAAEGFLRAQVGSGTFVAEGAAAGAPRRAPVHSPLVAAAGWRALAQEPRPPAAARYDFRLGAPDPALFPWAAWRGALACQLRGRRLDDGLGAPAGEPTLRRAVARHLSVSRGVRAGADDVVITSGAQQAFDLVARVLLAPGTCAAVEDPGYPPARHALAAAGARVVPVPVDAEGLVVDALPDAARLVYVTPSHQFPLGVPMSLARRQALLAWAERRGAAILEDDYDSELRLDGRPLEPLQSLDRAGRVLYVGTFSKVLSPSLRLGFLIAPTALVPALAAARAVSDGFGAVAPQRALAALIDDGELARHVRRLIARYRERRDLLASAMERHLGGRAQRWPASAGLHLAASLRGRVRLDDALARARQAGVAVESLERYYLGRSSPMLALGYGLIQPADLDEGVRRLARALASR